MVKKPKSNSEMLARGVECVYIHRGGSLGLQLQGVSKAQRTCLSEIKDVSRAFLQIVNQKCLIVSRPGI